MNEKKKWREMNLKRCNSTRRTLWDVTWRKKRNVLDLYFVSIFTIHMDDFFLSLDRFLSALYSALSDSCNCSLSIIIVIVGIGALFVFIAPNSFFCVCLFESLNFTVLFELFDYVLLHYWFIFVSLQSINSMCIENNSDNNNNEYKKTRWHQTKYKS